MGRKVFGHLQESSALPGLTVTWEDKHHNPEFPHPMKLSQAIYWAWWYGISLLPVLVLSSRAWDAEKSLAKGCFFLETSGCYQHCSHTKWKTLCIPAAAKNMNSVPDKTRKITLPSMHCLFSADDASLSWFLAFLLTRISLDLLPRQCSRPGW